MHFSIRVSVVLAAALLSPALASAADRLPELQCRSYFSFAPYGAGSHPALAAVPCPEFEETPVYVRVYRSGSPLDSPQCVSRIAPADGSTARPHAAVDDCEISDPQARWVMELHCCRLLGAEGHG